MNEMAWIHLNGGDCSPCRIRGVCMRERGRACLDLHTSTERLTPVGSASFLMPAYCWRDQSPRSSGRGRFREKSCVCGTLLSSLNTHTHRCMKIIVLFTSVVIYHRGSPVFELFAKVPCFHPVGVFKHGDDLYTPAVQPEQTVSNTCSKTTGLLLT